MSIFAAPSFYNQADQNIFNQGNRFITQQPYRLGDPIPMSTGTSGAAAATGINTVPINMGGGGGGGGFNPYNPDMNRVRTDFRPDTEFRRFNEFGITSLDDASTMDLKTMESYPEYFGLPTGAPKTGIAGIFDKVKNFLPGVGFLSRVGPALQNVLPVNQRAILENQLRGQGVLTDDIGRIVSAGDYNTPEGIMAGYNANKMTGATFDKRTDDISKTLKDRTSLTQDQIDDIVNEIETTGTYSGDLTDEDLGLKNLFSNLVNVNLAKYNFLNAQAKAQEIADFREQQRIDAINKKKAEAKAAGDAARARALQIKAAAKVQGISRREAERQQQAIEDQNRESAPGRGDAGNPGGSSGAMTDDNAGTYCFDPNTFVQMADGSEKRIKEIQLGDQTKGGEVTGVFQFKASDEIHDYKGVTVAGSHYVKEDGKFIMVKDSPISVKIDKIPVVYSLDTTGRRIFIKDIEFADYNGDGIAKGFLANAGVNISGFDKEVLRQVENRLI